MRGRAYVEAAVASGGAPCYTMWRQWPHILPAVSPLVTFNTVMIAGGAILAEAGLQFLGFGDPRVVSWGSILYELQAGRAVLFGAWRWIISLGLAIFPTVLGFMLTGYAFEVLNPHSRRERV
ncbi:MAG: hypothetical protein H5T95_03965 [Firmicutes bacterium]|nr:hypothetical protein [Bacillota bacterium]